jgi:hypothetical protein
VTTPPPRITYGDLLAVGYLLGEFNQDAGAALRFCEENSVDVGVCMLLREAERRSHYNRIPRRKVKPDGS